MILDIHSHRQAPYPEGIISLRVSPVTGEPDRELLPGQLYSAGIHPWDTADGCTPQALEGLRRLLENPQVVAVGECGVDLTRSIPLFRQLQVLKSQLQLAEELKKPVVLHCVKGADIIMGLKRDLVPEQRWIIHGFRGKPALASQLTAKGIGLSYGENFNPEAVKVTPRELLYAETDESPLDIREIRAKIGLKPDGDATLEEQTFRLKSGEDIHTPAE